MNENQVTKKLENIFIKNFKIKKKKLKSLSIGTFYKWDSLSHIRLMIEIEKKYQIVINNNTSYTLTSYNKIRDYLIKFLVK